MQIWLEKKLTEAAEHEVETVKVDKCEIYPGCGCSIFIFIIFIIIVYFWV